jgi:hypothetical protein
MNWLGVIVLLIILALIAYFVYAIYRDRPQPELVPTVNFTALTDAITPDTGFSPPSAPPGEEFVIPSQCRLYDFLYPVETNYELTGTWDPVAKTYTLPQGIYLPTGQICTTHTNVTAQLVTQTCQREHCLVGQVEYNKGDKITYYQPCSLGLSPCQGLAVMVTTGATSANKSCLTYVAGDQNFVSTTCSGSTDQKFLLQRSDHVIDGQAIPATFGRYAALSPLTAPSLCVAPSSAQAGTASTVARCVTLPNNGYVWDLGGFTSSPAQLYYSLGASGGGVSVVAGGPQLTIGTQDNIAITPLAQVGQFPPGSGKGPILRPEIA